MKRDMDLIRDLLLKIEDEENKARSSELIGDSDEAEKNRINNHIRLLYDAGFIKGIVSTPLSGRWRIQEIELTWQGHDLASTIRDPEIWSQTKDAAKTAGTGAIDFVWGIAKEVAKAEIKRRTGIDVG